MTPTHSDVEEPVTTDQSRFRQEGIISGSPPARAFDNVCPADVKNGRTAPERSNIAAWQRPASIRDTEVGHAQTALV